MKTILTVRAEDGDVFEAAFCDKHLPEKLPGELKRVVASEDTLCEECWGIHVLGPMLRALERKSQASKRKAE
jgi:hypothetical protein